MRVLVKIPSRERPMELMEVLQEVRRLRAPGYNTRVLVSVDDDDETMKDRVPFTPGMIVDIVLGKRVSKIEAINRDLEKFDWDVVIVLADDMIPVTPAFDSLVATHMQNLFPDMDGMLWLSDGRQEKFCTIPVMGRKYWEAHGKRIYHDSYHSYCCDVEQTELAMSEGKMTKIEGPFAMHLHSMFSTPRKAPRKADALLRHNQSYKQRDRENLIQRRALGYPQS